RADGRRDRPGAAPPVACGSARIRPGHPPGTRCRRARGSAAAARAAPDTRRASSGRARPHRPRREHSRSVRRRGELAQRSARSARGRRGHDRRDALGRRCGGAIGRCPRGSRLRRGGRRMSRSRWLVRGLLLFVLAFANLNDIRSSDTSQGGEAPGLWSPDVLVHGGHVVAAIVEILATLILWSVLRRFATPRWSLMLMLLYFLATSVRTVASQALWQHSGVHLAVASALWLTLREEPIPLSRDLAAGVVLGLGGVVRQTTALVSVGLHGFRPTRIFWMLVGTVIGLAPLLAYNDLAFGSPLEQGYGVKSFA